MCTHTHVCVYTHTHTQTHTHVHTHVYTHMHTHTHTHMSHPISRPQNLKFFPKVITRCSIRGGLNAWRSAVRAVTTAAAKKKWRELKMARIKMARIKMARIIKNGANNKNVFKFKNFKSRCWEMVMVSHKQRITLITLITLISWEMDIFFMFSEVRPTPWGHAWEREREKWMPHTPWGK